MRKVWNEKNKGGKNTKPVEENIKKSKTRIKI